MKAKVLFTIYILFFSSMMLFAQEKNTIKVLKVDDENQTKEYIAYDSNNKKALYRTIYQYNDDNNRIKRNTYLLKKGEWVNSKRYEYIYNNDKKPLYIIYTEWNEKVKDWNTTSELILHLYDKNGNFLSVTKVRIDSRYNFLTEK